MTMYQSLLMALVSLPTCVLENWDLKSRCKLNLSAQKVKYSFKVLNMTSSCLKLNKLLYLFVKDLALYLYCFSAIYNSY